MATARRAAATSSRDRKSTRLNSSHLRMSYAVFCLKKTKQKDVQQGVKKTSRRGRAEHEDVGATLQGAAHGDTKRFAETLREAGMAVSVFFNDAATPGIYPLPLQDALPI